MTPIPFHTVVLPDGWLWVTMGSPFDCFLVHPSRRVSEVVGLVEQARRDGAEGVPS